MTKSLARSTTPPHKDVAGQHVSQLQRAWQKFCANRLAVFCLFVLAVIHGAAIFADFLSPYSFSNEDRSFSYAPPSRVHFIDEKGHWRRPFIYESTIVFDQNHKREYQNLIDKKYPVVLLAQGERYKILGFIPCSLHLFGVKDGGRFYLCGADSRGRDLFSRLLYGARVSLSIGILGVMISFSIGLLVGGIAGFYGGKVDDILMRVCEMFMLSPSFYLLLALRAVVPASFTSLQVYAAIIGILSFINWASLARVIRGMCLSLKEREYVLAAKTMGLSDIKIILRHILPHTLSYSLIAVMLSIPGYILAESSLSLIGLGIQDPYASWGNLLSEAMGIVKIRFAPWILLPGFFILITVMCFNIVGDALRDALDPKSSC